MIHERYIKPVNASPVVRRLTEVRMAWGLSIEAVAERIGCQPATLRKYELGLPNYNPSFNVICRWADVLGFELSIWPKKHLAASEPLFVASRVPRNSGAQEPT
jgi:transcriptional regulator with XRE-family HTH domain